MTLITKTQTEQLLANGRAQRAAMDKGEDALDFKPVVKLFTPDAQCTWLLTELDPDGGLAFGLCDLGLGEPELGYISLTERRTARGKLGLPIERDLHFDADEPRSRPTPITRANAGTSSPSVTSGASTARRPILKPHIQNGSTWLRNSNSQLHAPGGCANAAM
jgi:hypothetical protein